MEPQDEGAAWAPGAPDQLMVQFPQTLPTGMERPYFLQGDGRQGFYFLIGTKGKWEIIFFNFQFIAVDY